MNKKSDRTDNQEKAVLFILQCQYHKASPADSGTVRGHGADIFGVISIRSDTKVSIKQLDYERVKFHPNTYLRYCRLKVQRN
jgi:hypothetical protein